MSKREGSNDSGEFGKFGEIGEFDEISPEFKIWGNEH